MLTPDLSDTLADALDHVRYLRAAGITPIEAAASIGWRPYPGLGWDDITWALARALHTLRWGEVPE
jgi:hypothetical protein